MASLCQAGLLERVSPTSIVVHDICNIRVIAWMLSQNETARRLGKKVLFKDVDLPCDLIEDISVAAH